ncbi:GntR family transcriptional regulator [Sporomusa aerivorans]|uniref:GntR family transcriptional regulator n=1 Tax=Sporomusa aerivorans TaxID=204936 RepID=UPI00352A26C6
MESNTEKKSLSDIAYSQIKNMLLEFELHPGSAVTEIMFMQKFGISRTPVRQALQRLEQEGFMRLTPRKGWFVAGVSLRDIQEIFVVREALEGIAARLAAELLPQEVLDGLNLYMEKISSQEQTKDIDEVDPGDILHEKIFEAVNNQQMNRVLRLYNDQLRRFHIMASKLPGRALLSYKEHYEILRALTERNGEKAEKAMREHINSSKRSILDAVVNESYGKWFECQP